MIHSILRNFSIFAAATVVDRVITFLFLLYAARALGPDAFGQYLLVGSYVMFVTVVFMAGLLPVAVREIARQQDDPLPPLEQLLSLRLVLGVLAYAVLLVLAGFVLPAATFLPLAAVAGSVLVINSFSDSFTAYHTAFEKAKIPGIFQATAAIATAASGAVLLYLDFGVLALVTAGALVNLVMSVAWHVLFTKRVGRYRIRFGISAWKQMVVMMLPFAPVGLSMQLNRLAGPLMLSVVGGPLPPDRAVGYYGTAQQIAYLPVPVLFLLRRVLVPIVAGKLSRGERINDEFAVALKLAVLFVSFPLLVATSIFPREILLLAFGPDYLESAPALVLLGAAAALAIATILPETFMLSFPETKPTRFLTGSVTPLLINLALCVLLIPIYGAAGAAFAVLVARGAYMAFTLYYCRVVLPLDSLGFARLRWPLVLLCAAYAASHLAASAIDRTAWQVIIVGLIASTAMLACGYSELSFVVRRLRRGA